MILDRLQTIIGRPPASPNTETVSAKIRLLGAISHFSPVQDITRMLYYLTGMSTERSAVLAYNKLHAGMRDLGETALAETVVAPIRRQEPPHYAFYKLSPPTWRAGSLPGRRGWSAGYGCSPGVRWAPTTPSRRPTSAASDRARHARRARPSFGEEISRVERDLLFERKRGLDVPSYVVDALREAVALYDARGTPF